jgi:hypothetical protein
MSKKVVQLSPTKGTVIVTKDTGEIGEVVRYSHGQWWVKFIPQFEFKGSFRDDGDMYADGSFSYSYLKEDMFEILDHIKDAPVRKKKNPLICMECFLYNVFCKGKNNEL